MSNRVKVPVPTLRSCLLALWEERPPEYGMLVEPQAPVWLRRRPTHGRQKENQRTARAKERALWNEETKLQLWNNSRIWFSRALRPWHRLRNLVDHRALIPKVGGGWTCDTGAAILAFPLDVSSGHGQRRAWSKNHTVKFFKLENFFRKKLINFKF